MKNLYAEFTQCYPLSKTLRFSLLPQGKTAENIKKYGILAEDQEKLDMYKQVKGVFDRCHKRYIEEVLSQLTLDWSPLAGALLAYQKDSSEANKKALEKARKTMCVQISKKLKTGENYKNLAPKALVDAAKNKLSAKPYCGAFVDCLTPEELEQIAFFDRFSTYFNGYTKNRNNMYAAEGTTSIACRLVEDNFPKFMANRSLLAKLDAGLVRRFEAVLSDEFGVVSLDEVFGIEAFNTVLSQNGIERYNLLLGGKTEEGEVKRQGLNELCNLAYQQGELAYKVRFAELYKQILADREKASFVPEAFATDQDVLVALDMYAARWSAADTQAAINAFCQVLSTGAFDSAAVYVDEKQVAILSNLVYGEWDTLRIALGDKGVKKQKVYALADLQQVAQGDILAVYRDKLREALEMLCTAKQAITPVLSQYEITDYAGIKAFLDAVVTVEQLFKIFAIAESYEKDSAFYGDFDVVYALLRENISLYNKVRNYATKKPYSTEKFKLNFGNAILANGWDQNKVYHHNAIILLKDGRYYLGIFNAKNKQRLPESNTPVPGAYRKMVYKQISMVHASVPKAFFTPTGIKRYGVNEDVLAGYNEDRHLKGDRFDLAFCHQLIDYFKEKIAEHLDWSKFGFRFSDTESYNDISEFYREVAEQGYKISYSYVRIEDIDAALENGSLFLFEIYNKDFSAQSTGTPNLHTLYWRQIFAEENLQTPVFKLNGGAELFYRPASVDNPFVHRQGEILVGKTDVDKQPIADELYRTILAAVAGGASIETLRATYPTVNFRPAPHDIVKDKRYSRDAFAFHVPITLNCNARGSVNCVSPLIFYLITPINFYYCR